MKNNSISVLIFLVAFLSCRKGDTYRLSSDKLKDVVRDMYLVDLNVSAHPKAYRDSITETYMQQIVRIHGVAREDIEHDLALLQSDFDLLDTIYADILKEGKEMVKIKTKSHAKKPGLR